MLHVLKTAEPTSSNSGPENANLPMGIALNTYTTGTIYGVSFSSGVPAIYIRADVVDGKVALWLDHGGSEKLFGEPDILEITGPPELLGVELRIRDFTIGSVAYKVSGTNDSGSITGQWARYETTTESGIQCVLSMPEDTAQANWIKFTISATPPTGHDVPLQLDPLTVIKKDG